MKRAENILYMGEGKYVLEGYIYGYNVTEDGHTYTFGLKEGVELVV